MVNHKILYKITLVLGLLLTMILTLSLTKYSITYAEEKQPSTTDTESFENDRFDFDSELLKQAREIIGTDSRLSDEQISKLHQLGFNDSQITLLIEIIQNDTSINTEAANDSSWLLFVYIPIIFILLLGIAFVYTIRHKRFIY